MRCLASQSLSVDQSNSGSNHNGPIREAEGTTSIWKFWNWVLFIRELDVLIIVTSCHKFCIVRRRRSKLRGSFQTVQWRASKAQYFDQRNHDKLSKPDRPYGRKPRLNKVSCISLRFRAFCEADFRCRKKWSVAIGLFWPLHIVFCLFKTFKRAIFSFVNHC